MKTISIDVFEQLRKQGEVNLVVIYNESTKSNVYFLVDEDEKKMPTTYFSDYFFRHIAYNTNTKECNIRKYWIDDNNQKTNKDENE